MSLIYPVGFFNKVITQTLILRTAGTAIGNMTGGGGLAAGFDGNTVQTAAASPLKSPSVSGYGNFIGKDWGSGVTKVVSRVKLYASSNASALGGGGTTYKLQGSTDNFASSTVDLFTSGTVLATSASTSDDSTGFTKTTDYRYHRIAFNGNGANDLQFAELEWYEDI